MHQGADDELDGLGGDDGDGGEVRGDAVAGAVESGVEKRERRRRRG